MAIHKLLTLSRPLFLIDCETTGVNVKSDRIVELGFQQWTAEGMVKEWRSLIDPGVPIPADAVKTHGITDEMLKACRFCGQPAERHPLDNPETIPCLTFGPILTFAQLAPNLAIGFHDCDFAGKNVRFDLRILAAEMRRAGVGWSYAGSKIIDADRLEQLAVPRSLSHLHEKYVGRPHDGAHGALSDVRASATVIAAQLEAHENLPRDLALLHEAQWPGWLDDEGSFRMVNGVATCQFGRWRGRAMKDINKSYWDWILRSDFPADVKSLARNAKLGQFPEEKS